MPFPLLAAGLSASIVIRDKRGTILWEVPLTPVIGLGKVPAMNAHGLQAVAENRADPAPGGVAGRIEAQPNDIADAIAAWCDFMRGRNRKPKSVSCFRTTVERAAREQGWTRVEDLTFESVTGYLSGHPWKTATYNRHLAAFRGLTRWLVAADRLPKDPLAMICPRQGEGDFGARAATLEEARAVIRAAWICQQTDRRAAKGNRALYWLCLFSMGLRAGEPEQWRWSDLDLDSTPPVIVWRPEIQKNRRRQIVPIPTETAALLRQLRGQIRIQDGPVFPIVPSRGSFRVERNRAGIPAKDARGYGFSPHSARKFLASWLASKNIQQGMIDRLMRHSGSVSARYFDPSIQDMADALAVVPSLWPEKIHGITEDPLTGRPNEGKMKSPDADPAQDQPVTLSSTHANPITTQPAASRRKSATSTKKSRAGLLSDSGQVRTTSSSPVGNADSNPHNGAGTEYIRALEVVVRHLLTGAGHGRSAG